MPGGITLLGILIIYWTFFLSQIPLGFATYRPGLITWTAVGIASYILGHAVQGVGNVLYHDPEVATLSDKGSAPLWMRERAAELAAKILGIGTAQLTPHWTFRTLDEYAVQIGKPGDRDMFVYREGFYKGTAIALFFVSLSLVVRSLPSRTMIQFTPGFYYISRCQILLTALITSFIGRMFGRRFWRFADYRITRAVLASLVVDSFSAENDTEGDPKGGTPKNDQQE